MTGRRIVAWSVGVLVFSTACYALILGHPEWLFSQRLDHGDFRVYARDSIPRELEYGLETAQTRLVASPLYQPGYVRRVFVAGSPRWYAFFTGPGKRAMAKNFELGNSIFLPRLNADGRTIEHFDGRRAAVVPILVHEAAHTDLQRHTGLLQLWRLPFWKKEGYSEMVAYGDSMGLDVMRALLLRPDRLVERQPGMLIPRRYWEAEAAWRYLIDHTGESVASVLAMDASVETILSRITSSPGK